jgi:hypothetical protein
MVTAVVYLLISRSLPSKGTTFNNIETLEATIGLTGTQDEGKGYTQSFEEETKRNENASLIEQIERYQTDLRRLIF